jgi:chromosomal replication initiator protein
VDNFVNNTHTLLFAVIIAYPTNEMEQSEKQNWKNVLESLKVSVSSAIFTTWFAQTHLVSLKENEGRYIAEVGCASSFVKSTIENRYFGLLQDTLSKVLNAPCDLLFVIKASPEKHTEGKPTPLFDIETTDTKNVDFMNALNTSGIRSSFNFENFAVSSSNQMAWAAAEAVTNSPGSAYNPLFIWGGVGVGKTHLMNAVGYMLLKKDPGSKVVCCTGEDFTNDIVDGIRTKTTQAVRQKYRKLKALFVDDIQFIAGKDAIQEEFFHTFNTLARSGGQIILTSDRPPGEISKLEERLQSRFEAGLIVDIAPPDFELRCAIIQIKAQDRGIDMPMDMVQLIAGNLDSARKIEGFLVKLVSQTKLKSQPATPEIIESLLGKGVETNGTSRRVDPSEVINAVAKYYSVGKRNLLGGSRARPVAMPRQILMYYLRTQLSLPLQEVGRLVGGRDHTTVMHAVEKITHLASNSVDIRQDIQGIKSIL